MKPRMPLDTDAYLADTGHLSTVQHGAYLLLLMAIWRSKDGWLPGDDGFLSRATHQTLDKWRRMAPTIRALLKASDGRVSQKRAQKEREAATYDPSQNPSQDSSTVPKPLKTNGPISETAKTVSAAESAPLPFLEPEEVKKSLPSKKVKGSLSTLAADWQPTVADLDYAAQHGFDRKRAYEIAGAFADHHRSKGNRMADWSAAWRNWIRNEVKFNAGGRHAANRTGGDRGGSAGRGFGSHALARGRSVGGS